MDWIEYHKKVKANSRTNPFKELLLLQRNSHTYEHLSILCKFLLGTIHILRKQRGWMQIFSLRKQQLIHNWDCEPLQLKGLQNWKVTFGSWKKIACPHPSGTLICYLEGGVVNQFLWLLSVLQPLELQGCIVSHLKVPIKVQLVFS